MTIWCAVIVRSHNYLKNKNKVADFRAIKLGYSPHSEGNFLTRVSSQFSGVALIPHGVTALVTLATLVPAGHRSSLFSAAPNKPPNDSCFRSPPPPGRVKVTVSAKGCYNRLYFAVIYSVFATLKSAVFDFFPPPLSRTKKIGRHACRCRLSGVIKNDAVGPLLSDTSHGIRIFMAPYLSPFCWHKHAAQRRASPT